MNYLLTTFLKKAADDSRLLPSHLSLMMAVLYAQDNGGSIDAIKVSRRKLMHFSRVKSIATYHKCLKELIDFGYIRYQPSYHPTCASLIWILIEY